MDRPIDSALTDNPAASAYVETCLNHQPFADPNPLNYDKQTRFFASRARTRIDRSGNRTGKSEAGGREAAVLFAGIDPLDPKRRLHLPSKGWIIADGDLVHVVMAKFEKYCPPGIIQRVIRAKGLWEYESVQGSRIWIKTHDQERRKFQGEDLDWIWYDEETRKDIVAETSVRLIDRMGIDWWTLTPVDGTTWLHERFGGFPTECRNAQSGDMAWFCSGLMHNPYIPMHVRVKEMKRLMRELRGQPEMIAIRLWGAYILLGGTPLFKEDMLNNAYNDRKQPVATGYLRRAVVPEMPAEFIPDDGGNLTLWEYPKTGCEYVIGADVAMGMVDGDFSCAQIINRNTQEQSGVWHGHEDAYEFGNTLDRLGRYFNTALLVPEVNPPGNATLTALMHSRYPRLYQRETSRGEIDHVMRSFGVWTSASTKPKEVHTFVAAMADGEVTLHCPETMDELRRFRRVSKHNREAPTGAFGYAALSGHDDRVMALLHAWTGHCTAPIASRGKADYLPEQQFSRDLEADMKRQGIDLRKLLSR